MHQDFKCIKTSNASRLQMHQDFKCIKTSNALRANSRASSTPSCETLRQSEAKQFLVFPPLDASSLIIRSAMTASGRRRKSSYVPSESEVIDLK